MATFPELYTKGSRVWIPDIDQVWKLAYVKNDFVSDSKSLAVEDEDGEVIIVNSSNHIYACSVFRLIM